MIERILLPTDGSDHAAGALDAAVDLAERYGASLHLLFVVDTDMLPTSSGTMSLSTEDLTSLVEASGHEAVETLAEEVEGRGIEVTTEVRQAASAVDGIHAAIEEHGIDAVVMATHGRSGMDRVLLGSVTDRILRTSDALVLVVPSDVPRSP